jgi:hypothetical protein
MPKPQAQAISQVAHPCADYLKAFYSHHPDRQADFVRRKPDEARQLGLASGPSGSGV